MIDPDETYQQQPLEVIIELGKLSYSGAQLEATAYLVAESLHLSHQRKLQVTAVLENCARKVKEHGAPPWVADHRATGERVLEWIKLARTAFSDRNVAIHSFRLFIRREERWVGVELSNRTENSTANVLTAARPLDVGNLRKIRLQLEAAQHAGIVLMTDLWATTTTGDRVQIMPVTDLLENGYPRYWEAWLADRSSRFEEAHGLRSDH